MTASRVLFVALCAAFLFGSDVYTEGGQGPRGKPDQETIARWAAATERRYREHHPRGHDPLDLSCARIAPGAGGGRDRAIDLSAAHALVRYFSVESPFATADTALAAALKDDDSLLLAGLPATLARYARDLSDVCALPADPRRLGPAQVSSFQNIAIIKPGTGSIQLPAATAMVVIDLRDLPATDALDEILPRLAATAMATPITPSPRFVRDHYGPVDEVFSAGNVYSTNILLKPQPALAPAGVRDLPMVLLVGDRISPQAAAFAATMRLARRAWIAGDDVPMTVAESMWRGVGSHGIAVRTAMTVNALPPSTETLAGQVAHQDYFADPSTASYHYDFAVAPNTMKLDIVVDQFPGADLDFFVALDANGDGTFQLFDEFVGGAFTADAVERFTMNSPPPGNYRLFVHGYDVPGGETTFDLAFTRTMFETTPDTLSADFSDRPLTAANLQRLAPLVIGQTPPPVSGPATRATPEVIHPFGFRHPAGQSRGELRAGLIAAHGSLRLFFPYFAVVGDTIDDRLVETLAAAGRHEESDRVDAWRILKRFGAALHDGHHFVFDDFSPLTSHLAAVFEHVDNRPVVRRSLAPGVNPGDTVVALEGRPIEQVYEEELRRTSAATTGYSLDLADRVIYLHNGPMTLTLENTSGVQRTVTVQPQGFADWVSLETHRYGARPSGPLTALGRPDLFYLNINELNQSAVASTIAAAAGAAGLIVDMRGYPNANHYEIVRRLIPYVHFSPQFTVTGYDGPGARWQDTSQYTLFPSGPPRYTGPIVLLTGPHAVSAAENFMQMLVGAHRLTAVVGQQSAGTNGNITGLQLPGGFEFSYTGMEVRNVDGSRFHGIGIVPDIDVPVTKADLRDGIDRDLLAAIAVFHP